MSAVIGFIAGVLLDIPTSFLWEVLYSIPANVIDAMLRDPNNHIGPSETVIFKAMLLFIHVLLYLILPVAGIGATAKFLHD